MPKFSTTWINFERHWLTYNLAFDSFSFAKVSEKNAVFVSEKNRLHPHDLSASNFVFCLHINYPFNKLE